ncbi:hypothetical protein ACTU45_09060 [Streptomyces sp. 24-1644]|uniref:hypothetical protein n=1 Tax=Streptomyces sp. 24-1644 TaxID=3457315 RepID=UPI003FA6F9D0
MACASSIMRHLNEKSSALGLTLKPDSHRIEEREEMHEDQRHELERGQAIEACRELALQGWESARLALAEIEESGLASIVLNWVKVDSMAGIYGLRREMLSDEAHRTVDLDRFVRVLAGQNDEFICFFSVNLTEWRFLCALSPALVPIGSTAVRGRGEEPEAVQMGAVGEISSNHARSLCTELLSRGWNSAEIAVQAMDEQSPATLSIWIANPQTLADHYGRLANQEGGVRAAQGQDVERFTEVMGGQRQGHHIRIFHIFDGYGWQITCAISNDLTKPFGSVGIRRM